MRPKTNLVLLISVGVLFLILGFEIYYLFFYKHTPTNYQVNENKATETTGGLDGFWRGVSEKQTNMIFDTIIDHAKYVKPLFQSGVLKSYQITESYKTVITRIGPQDTVVKAADGTEVRIAYEIQFSTQLKTGKKEQSILLSSKELLRAKAYKAVGDERVEINLKDIKAGDFVAITMSIDYNAVPDEGILSLEIEKLL